MSRSCLLYYAPSLKSSAWKECQSNEDLRLRYRSSTDNRSSYLGHTLLLNGIVSRHQSDITSRPSNVRRVSSRCVRINRERVPNVYSDSNRLHNSLSAFTQTANKQLDSIIHGASFSPSLDIQDANKETNVALKTYSLSEHDEMCMDFSLKVLDILETTNKKDGSLDQVQPAKLNSIELLSPNESTVDYVDAIQCQHVNQGLDDMENALDIQGDAHFDASQQITVEDIDIEESDFSDIEESDANLEDFDFSSDSSSDESALNESQQELKSRTIISAAPHQHTYKSAGSRSSPSRSSIPGRRSKYSKPDPKPIKNISNRLNKQHSHLFGLKNNVLPNLVSMDSKKKANEDAMDKMDFDLHASDDVHFSSRNLKLDEITKNREVSYTLQSEEEMLTGHVITEQESSVEEVLLLLSNSNLDSNLSGENGNQDGEDGDATLTSFPGNKYNSTSSGAIDGATQVLTTKELLLDFSDMDDLSSSVNELSDKDGEKCEPIVNGKIHVKENLQLENNMSLFSTTCDKSDKSVSWNHHPLCDLPFEIQFSYSETSNAPISDIREQCSPFGPATMQRPWTGGPPVKRRRHLQATTDQAFKLKKGFQSAFYPEDVPQKPRRSRQETLGKSLTKQEIMTLVQKSLQENRQVNLGRDGLTHNMLHLIHTHWKKRPVCKIKCRGVPTVDMENLCFHIEDKTGGKIIHQDRGSLYVFRGRNYNYKERPRIPLMLWKPLPPLYPKLVSQAPPGLTKEEARIMRVLGQKVEPLCKLRKNAVFLSLVNDVRDAFMVDDLVCLDYEGLKSKDYKKIAAKLRDIVPCVILSFRNKRILLWKGRDSRNLSACAQSSGRLMGSEVLPGHLKSIASQSQSMQHDKSDKFQKVQETIISYKFLDSDDGRGNSSEAYHGQGSDARLKEKCDPTDFNVFGNQPWILGLQ